MRITATGEEEWKRWLNFFKKKSRNLILRCKIFFKTLTRKFPDDIMDYQILVIGFLIMGLLLTGRVRTKEQNIIVSLILLSHRFH